MNLNKKIWFRVLLLVCLSGVYAAKADDVLTLAEDGGWKVKALKYSASSGRLGYIDSITVAGKEFLSQKKNLPGGFYICHNGFPALKDIRKIDERTIVGQNKFAQVEYQFKDDEIVCTLTSKADSLHVYLLMNSGVETVITGNGKMLEVPAKTSCSSTKWIQGTAGLNISGVNDIWGPWHGVQVVNIGLRKDEKRIIRFTPVSVYKTGDKELEKSSAGLSRQSFTYQNTTEPTQIPICMIGDSITWAGDGDCWRKELITLIPRLAFVGTHTARLGYSHAGEGGNTTHAVLNRIESIPDCPNYVLHIGTNNNNVKEPGKVDLVARATADQIKQIVLKLLKKKGCEKVFLCAVFPCSTSNPLRDKCNSATNKYLRAELSEFPEGKVVWVEYEKKLRVIPGWEKLIQLHPTQEGYKYVAKILADELIDTFELTASRGPARPKKSTGVRVYNLWDEAANATTVPIIAGWYTLSMRIKEINGENPVIELLSVDPSVRFPLKKTFAVKGKAGQRVSFNFFTGYERYNFSRTRLKLSVVGCNVDQIMLEKTRPSQKPSVYGAGNFIDSISPTLPGELIEFSKQIERQ